MKGYGAKRLTLSAVTRIATQAVAEIRDGRDWTEMTDELRARWGRDADRIITKLGALAANAFTEKARNDAGRRPRK